MTVVGSGLRAVTKEHGLTEYWANRYNFLQESYLQKKFPIRF